jgi:hypothetical protein
LAVVMFASCRISRRGKSENRFGEGTRKSKNWSCTDVINWPVEPDGSLERMSEASSSRRERGREEVKDRWYDEYSGGFKSCDCSARIAFQLDEAHLRYTTDIRQCG